MEFEDSAKIKRDGVWRGEKKKLCMKKASNGSKLTFFTSCYSN